ncbi:MAG: cation diffusion facilitator family transporter [Planctomycetota bacterium]
MRRCDRCARILIYIGIAEALIFVILKISLGLACGSRALVAASLYSIQDLFSSIVAAIGISISARPPDRDHPYGHGKVEFFVVVVMSLMILLGIIALAVTALASIFGGTQTVEHPSMLVLWLALICGLSCWLLAKWQECAAEKLNSPALRSCATHLHSDYVSSVAVAVSVIGARLGYPALDHIVAVIEAVHVVFVSGRMLGSALNGLMDTAVDPPLLEKMRKAIREMESVERVSSTVARWSGQTLMAQVDVEVSGKMDALSADQLREGIQHAVKKQVCRQSETLVRISPVSVP